MWPFRSITDEEYVERIRKRVVRFDRGRGAYVVIGVAADIVKIAAVGVVVAFLVWWAATDRVWGVLSGLLMGFGMGVVLGIGVGMILLSLLEHLEGGCRRFRLERLMLQYHDTVRATLDAATECKRRTM